MSACPQCGHDSACVEQFPSGAWCGVCTDQAACEKAGRCAKFRGGVERAACEQEPWGAKAESIAKRIRSVADGRMDVNNADLSATAQDLYKLARAIEDEANVTPVVTPVVRSQDDLQQVRDETLDAAVAICEGHIKTGLEGWDATILAQTVVEELRTLKENVYAPRVARPIAPTPVMNNDELADSLEQIAAGIQPDAWLAYDDFPKREASTIAHFGDYTVGFATPGFPGGNYRDPDLGDDETHACMVALLRNHLPQIIAALRVVTPRVRSQDAVLKAAQRVCAVIGYTLNAAGIVDSIRVFNAAKDQREVAEAVYELHAALIATAQMVNSGGPKT